MVSNSPKDPLAILIAPSESETPDERESRLRQEEEAKRISNAIDEELNRQRKAPAPVKILLLGQSESGKSTTLKNFQLMHAPKAFGRERASWRAVIYLNIVRAFHLIMDAMDSVQRSECWLDDEDSETFSDIPKFTPDLLKVRRRLSPLLHVEQSLLNQFCPSSPGGQDNVRSTPELSKKGSFREIAVNSAIQWKESFGKLVRGDGLDSSTGPQGRNNPDDPVPLLQACRDDMILLWNDTTVQDMLYKMKVNMEDHASLYVSISILTSLASEPVLKSSHSFLDSLKRVITPRYLPTDDDILRARLKTLGVSEHQFRVDTGAGIRKDWRIYDVGGHRSQRAAWVPFFDDMDAIIFLAPISAFNQMLEEDPKMNRLASDVSPSESQAF
ncbi:hypothetical protein NP233_g6079 [Leucocoprinus birnbaumii]|uniref:Uncharacterized protein n=1 Tax=Leucocoprinus birnbaumii TaxID=56174 RepID=A0AAD5VRU2_9AGAR|nr:hypothetical protein NP233_g6079 [Leucocoprinus birnbaumii]